MRLHVHVHGLHFVVPCGEGGQTCKWLGLVVAQRYALAVPHGRVRTREDAHLKPGFFLPANIVKAQGGQVLAPSAKIADVCKDNDAVRVELQQEVPVNEFGAPQLSPWTISAFSSQAKTADSIAAAGLKALHASDAKGSTNNLTMPAKAEHKESVSSTHPSEKADATSKEEEIKAYAWSEMLQQVNSGQFQSEMELEAAFLYDWSRLHVDELEKDPKEREAIHELLLGYFGVINTAYMHYAVGSGENGYGMNGFELAHFLHECGLFHFQQDFAAIEKIFSQCTRNDTFLSVHDRESLARVGFFHALLRGMLNSPRDTGGGSTKELLERTIKERIQPTVSRLTSGPFRDFTHQDKIVALYQEAKPKLIKLYTKYAQEHPRREPPPPGWPQLLTASGLKNMLYDCGVFCVGNTTAHEDMFSQAMEQCFQGYRGLRLFDDNEIVFAEFIEILTRVGTLVLEENAFPPKDAIKITINALRSLPVKPQRK